MERLLKWVRGSRSGAALIAMVALFVALFANIAFFTGVVRVYPPDAGNLPFVVSLFVYISSIFILTLSIVCHGVFTKPLLVAFLLLSSVIAYFMNHYGIIIDHRMIENVFSTNFAEARDLFSLPLVIYFILLGILPSLLVWKVPLVAGTWKKELFSRAALACFSLVAMVAAYFTFSAQYASMFRMQRALLAQINPTYAIFSAGKLGRIALKSGSFPYLIVGADAMTPRTDPDRELVIMVVGETARADHFSLNGYSRETNPLLKKEKVVSFTDFWSCGTSTAHSVPCMFSHLTRKEFKKERAKTSDNALDILKRAGVAILWRDNNSSSKGVADRVLYEHFSSPDRNPVCDTECRDEGMLAGLQDYINAHPTGDILIILHAMGNHGPAYYKRYPPAFEEFRPACKTSDLGACRREEVINAYDNAILYTDYVLSKAIELLKRNDDSFETAMFYVSDHGESLGENGLHLHGMPYFIAPKAQKHVPAIMWFGPNFDAEPIARMEQRRKERLSHDSIFSTLLGLFEVRSDAYDVKMDLLDHSKPEHW